MKQLALIMTDKALLPAVIEQWPADRLGDIVTATDLVQAYRDDSIAVLLVDESGFDKKIARALPDNRELLDKPILFLGAVPQAYETLFTETLSKPLRLGQLMARLHYYWDIVPRLRSQTLAFRGFRLEPQNRQLIVEATGDVIRLTEKETALVAFLGQSEKPVSREELLAAVWGYDQSIDTHTLETHIYQLRRKLDGDHGDVLVNQQGGYRLER